MDSAPRTEPGNYGFERIVEPAFQPPSSEEVLSAISKVRTADLAATQIDDLKAVLGPIMKGLTISTPVLGPGKSLYRGRIMDKRPAAISELSYPPPSLSRTYQRANRPGQPLFYASTAFPSVLIELNPSSGSCVAISKWMTTAKLVVNNAGYTDEAFRILGTKRMLPDWYVKGSNEQPRTEVGRFMAEEFTKRVLPGHEHLYKVTAAIAELYFEQSQFGGLLYPSVALSAASDNLAVKPHFVDTSMHPVAVEYLRIEHRTTTLVDGPIQDEMKIRVLATSSRFGNDGEIHWLEPTPETEA